MLATVLDVKQFLKVQTSDDDSLLALLLEGVSGAIEGEVGFAIESVTKTEVIRSTGQVGLPLSNPVVSITSVAEGSSVLASTGYRVEGRTLQRLSNSVVIAWPLSDVTVVYRAGFQNVPADLRMAAVQQTAFEYKQAAGGGGRLGLSSNSPSQGGEATNYETHDLLPAVLRTVRRHRSVY